MTKLTVGQENGRTVFITGSSDELIQNYNEWEHVTLATG